MADCPDSARRTAISRPRIVFPDPGPPLIIVSRPSGRPPWRTSSSPLTRVGIFGSVRGVTVNSLSAMLYPVLHQIRKVRRRCMIHYSGSLLNYSTGTIYHLPVYLSISVRVIIRSEEHTSELQSRGHLVCRHLL